MRWTLLLALLLQTAQDAPTLKERATFEAHSYGNRPLAFSPDGKTLATRSAPDGLLLWDVENGKVLRIFADGAGPVGSLAFSPDGKTLAAENATAKEPCVKLWDPASGRESRTLAGACYGLAWSPDGKMLAAGDKVGSIVLWDTSSWERLAALEGEGDWLWSVTFSPDGTQLACCGRNGLIRIWDTGSGKRLRILRGHKGMIQSVAFSPDGKTLASGGHDKTVRLWEVAGGKAIRTLTGHEKEVSAVSFSPDGKLLASGGADDMLRIWDPATGTEVRKVSWTAYGILSVAFSPDGKHLAAGGLGQVRIWDGAFGTDPIGKLITDLRSDDLETRDRATEELIKLGKLTLPALKSLLASADGELKARAQKALDAIHEARRAKALMLELGTNRKQYEPGEAIHASVRLKNSEDLPVVALKYIWDGRLAAEVGIRLFQGDKDLAYDGGQGGQVFVDGKVTEDRFATIGARDSVEVHSVGFKQIFPDGYPGLGEYEKAKRARLAPGKYTLKATYTFRIDKSKVRTGEATFANWADTVLTYEGKAQALLLDCWTGALEAQVEFTVADN